MATSKTDNTTNSLEWTYAAALLEMADGQDRTDDLADELKQLGQLMDDQPDVLRLLSSRVLSTSQLADSIEKIFKGRVSDLLYRFLQIANQKGRFDSLPGIIRAYRLLLDDRNGVVEAEVFVATPLSPELAQEVSSRVGQHVGRIVTLKQTVVPELIGGLKVRVGDTLIDGSVATQLRLMCQRIEFQGRETAKNNLDKILAQA